jgi:hypothetical protein
MALIELTANPFAEAISCKVKTTSPEARHALVRRYKAIVCGDEVYFGIPWNGARPAPEQPSSGFGRAFTLPVCDSAPVPVFENPRLA